MTLYVLKISVTLGYICRFQFGLDQLQNLTTHVKNLVLDFGPSRHFAISVHFSPFFLKLFIFFIEITKEHGSFL